ncbi:sm-like ribonucleo protein [Rhizophagus irregularis DAOM 181602=DAOM 197198]|nr:sm-like ribonucleo protein [Rhizophagus irregularis DAOM 181602=DAOM 197198]
MSIGVPIKLLHEAQGHVVTLELNNGTVYRGKLSEAEDNMNVQLREITVTARDGRVSQLDQVYIRGSHVRFFIVPDMLKNAPMFKKIGPNAMKGRGIGMGRGKATVARAQARGGRGRAGFRGVTLQQTELSLRFTVFNRSIFYILDSYIN